MWKQLMLRKKPSTPALCCKGCIFCRSRRNLGLLSASKWMQKNKKIVSETTELATRISSFFIETTLHNSSQNASHHSSLGTEPNSAGFQFSILSHNCLIFLSNSISQDKPEQMYLTFSRCKGLSRFQAHILEDWYFALTPSSCMTGSLLPWEEPTWDRTHVWMAPESVFQNPETAMEPVVTTEFLGEPFPQKMRIFPSDGTSFLSRFFKMKFNTEFRLWSQQCRHKLCLAKHGCPAFLLGTWEKRDGYKLQ